MKVIFIDGDCLLCKGIVRLIFSLDKRGKFKFSSLQGECAKDLLPPHLIENLDTVVYYNNEIILTKSNAAIEVASELGLFFKIFKLFYFLPSFFRDYLYMLISRNRKRIFKRQVCTYSQDLQNRFLK